MCRAEALAPRWIHLDDVARAVAVDEEAVAVTVGPRVHNMIGVGVLLSTSGRHIKVALWHLGKTVFPEVELRKAMEFTAPGLELASSIFEGESCAPIGNADQIGLSRNTELRVN